MGPPTLAVAATDRRRYPRRLDAMRRRATVIDPELEQVHIVDQTMTIDQFKMLLDTDVPLVLERCVIICQSPTDEDDAVSHHGSSRHHGVVVAHCDFVLAGD
jgi:hypothetical protein